MTTADLLGKIAKNVDHDDGVFLLELAGKFEKLVAERKSLRRSLMEIIQALADKDVEKASLVANQAIRI